MTPVVADLLHDRRGKGTVGAVLELAAEAPGMVDHSSKGRGEIGHSANG